ncbi:MAG TPA: AlpA family transcriptional regulator [Terracidiphilus sp.]|jgi:prophage regulatory protein
MDEKILRLPAVKDRTGLSRSSVYEKIAAGDFPKPISLGARAVGWLESDIEAWIDGRVGVSRSTQSIRPGLDEARMKAIPARRSVR